MVVLCPLIQILDSLVIVQVSPEILLLTTQAIIHLVYMPQTFIVDFEFLECICCVKLSRLHGLVWTTT